MAVLNVFENIIERCEFLKRVCYIIHPDLPDDISAVRTEFSESTVFIVVNADDDTLYSVQRLPDELTGTQPADFSDDYPWKDAIGKPLRWAWALRNNRGYLDGMQFEFAINIEDKETAIQMMGMASGISVRSVSEIHRVLPIR